MHWYTDVIRRYAAFRGRADRPEFWWFTLWNTVILLVLIFGVGAATSAGQIPADIYILATFLPSLGVQIRRLHDTDRSGWWVLLSLVPLLGAIFLIGFLASSGTPGANRYGSPPHAGAEPALAT